MSQSFFTFATRSGVALALFGLLWLLPARSLMATPLAPASTLPSVEIALPEKFGEIVYQSNPAAAANIYIIANGHRSAISGKNAAATVQAQIETFRIGEWLINQNQVELLLPEGFFGNIDETSPLKEQTGLLDNQSLQESLADTSVFVNAELLLHEKYGIGLDQIEDRTLYRRTRERLRSSLEPAARLSATFNRELDYLQKIRTATMLQSAPGVIDTAYQQGRISSPNAMLTIGLTHLDDILEFLEAGEIRIAALSPPTEDFPGLETNLELLKSQVGVTVIVPRTLIDRKLQLQKSRVTNDQKDSSSGASPPKSS